jgi:hypothetical protein
MPKKKPGKKRAAATQAKASKRSKAWAKGVATKYETPKKVGKTRKQTAVTRKKVAVVKTPGGKDGPGVVIEQDDGDDGDASD